MTHTQGEHAQTEALRLADDLEASSLFPGNMRSCNNAAAAELRRLHAQVAALTAAPGVKADLRQILLDPENQPNQYGVQFLMRGPKMAFRIGGRQFALDYEPDEPGEFEFMRDALIDAFSVFTHDVKTAPQPTPTAQAAPAADPAYSEACSLATALFEKHYRQEPDYASGRVVWSLCDTTAGVISQIDNMVSGLARAPAAGAVAGPSSADELARDLKKAIETATELREQLTLMEEHARGEVWRWQADGTDDLATMGNRMGVLIYASDLRNLIAAAPTPAAQADSVLEDADRWRMAVLVGKEVMLHPEKRTHANAVKAYMDAVHSGLDLTGAVDAARKQGAKHDNH